MNQVIRQRIMPTEAPEKKNFAPFMRPKLLPRPVKKIKYPNVNASTIAEQITNGRLNSSTSKAVTRIMTALFKKWAIIVGNTLPLRTARSAYAAPQRN